MAKQVRPWLMKPENGRAPTSARKQTGISQQNPSGTAASGPQQKSGCTAESKTCTPRHAKRKHGKAGGVHVRSLRSVKAAITLDRPSELRADWSSESAWMIRWFARPHPRQTNACRIGVASRELRLQPLRQRRKLAKHRDLQPEF